jgi:hypothetical protein
LSDVGGLKTSARRMAGRFGPPAFSRLSAFRRNSGSELNPGASKIKGRNFLKMSGSNEQVILEQSELELSTIARDESQSDDFQATTAESVETDSDATASDAANDVKEEDDVDEPDHDDDDDEEEEQDDEDDEDTDDTDDEDDLTQHPSSNKAVRHCILAYDRAYDEEIKKVDWDDDLACDDDAKEAGNFAYLHRMPPLVGYKNICDFIACVAYARILNAVDPDETREYMAAARIALGAVYHRPRARKTPGRGPGRPRKSDS